LATNYDAVEFEPHVTIFSGSSDDDEIRNTAPGVASRFSAVELTPRKLDFSSSYTKTLFIDFYESAVARHMFDAIKHGTAQPSAYVLNPHLSLLYKTMPAAAQAEICGTLEIPEGDYAFDRLRVIETEIPLTRPEQIIRWRTVFEAELRRP
jgi:hypothetical protein